eukprot:357885_1
MNASAASEFMILPSSLKPTGDSQEFPSLRHFISPRKRLNSQIASQINGSESTFKESVKLPKYSGDSNMSEKNIVVPSSESLEQSEIRMSPQNPKVSVSQLAKQQEGSEPVPNGLENSTESLLFDDSQKNIPEPQEEIPKTAIKHSSDIVEERPTESDVSKPQKDVSALSEDVSKQPKCISEPSMHANESPKDDNVPPKESNEPPKDASEPSETSTDSNEPPIDVNDRPDDSSDSPKDVNDPSEDVPDVSETPKDASEPENDRSIQPKDTSSSEPLLLVDDSLEDVYDLSTDTNEPPKDTNEPPNDT